MATDPSHVGDGDPQLVALLKSDVTKTWGRTARAAILIVCWGSRSRRWQLTAVLTGLLAAGGTVIAWLLR
jgi:hypothetical protein